MNSKIRMFLAASALTLSAAVSFGQNFNPTVEVTNVYQGKPSDVHKPLLEMSVPDSLLRFDLDFNYEVFDKPYEGAYSFKPYVVEMRPEKDAWRGRKLYLKAGAGYSLRPQFDFVYSPEQSGPFQMSVYASHKSYFGNYLDLETEKGVDGLFRSVRTGRSFSGYDALTDAGFDGLYSWERAILSFGIGYHGLATKDTVAKRAFNAVDFNIRLRSNSEACPRFTYDFGLRARVGVDSYDFTSFPGGKDVTRLNEGTVLFNGNVGKVFNEKSSAALGFEVESASYREFYEGSIGRLALVPKYVFSSGRWNLSLGVKIEAMLRGEATDTLAFRKSAGGKGQIVYPDVHVGFLASDNVLLYASATGGNRLNTYSSLTGLNHHFTPAFLADAAFAASPASGALLSLPDNTVEDLNAAIGVKGNISSRLQFDVKGGVAIRENALMESGLFTSAGSLVPVPVITYSDYNLIYAGALLSWRPDRFKVDASVAYSSMSFPEDEEGTVYGFRLPEVSGTLRASYEFTSRLSAGVDIDAASVRDGLCAVAGSETEAARTVRLPGYVDVGVFASFNLNRKWGLWLESGNLACFNIQRNPFYAERGPWGTLGITLNL